MGIRGEIFSTRVLLQNRTYFFNVKENRMGDLYLNIVESKNKDTGGFERQSVVLFAEDLQDFLKGFDDSLRVLEKAIRERKKSGNRADRGEGGRRESRGNEAGHEGREGHESRAEREHRDEQESRGGHEARDTGPAGRRRRLVAKKR